MEIYYNHPDIESLVGAGAEKNLDRNRADFLKTHDIFPAKVVTLKDPYRSGNIGIKITGVHQNDVPAEDVLFAPMIMPFGGGNNYGFFSMPPIGSDVYVTFLDGDLKNPVILGSWQSRKQIFKNQSSSNEISTAIGAGASYRSLADTVLTPASKIFGDSKQVFQLAKLTPASNDAIKGFALGQMNDIIKGTAGQVLGPYTAIFDFNTALDTVLGPPLTAVITSISTSVNGSIAAATSTSNVTPLLIQGKAQVASLVTQLNSAFTMVNTELTKIDTAIKGLPGLISGGLNSIVSDAFSGQLGAPIKDALTNPLLSPNLQTLIKDNIQKAATTGLQQVTTMSGVSSSLDAVIKNANLANAVTSGKITETDATKALKDNTVDWLLGKTEGGGEAVQVFGPQCPLPYRNMVPGRALEELGQNLTQNTDPDQEELNSCYLSQDLQTDSNGAIAPEPRAYIWKSPEGSSIEIDDTGFAEKGTGVDNRGVRLTTKKGALVHLVDQKDGECILIRDKNNNYIWINTITNDINIFSGNNMGEKITKDKTTTCVNMSETMAGAQITTVAKDQKETISGNKYSNTLLNRIEGVGSNWSITVNGDANIFGNNNVGISAAKQVIVGSGLKASLSSDVEVRIKAPIINIGA